MKKEVIIVVVLLIILGLAAIALGPKKDDYASGKLFQDLQLEKIDNIEIISDSRSIKFKKEGQDWFIKNPVEAKAMGVYLNKAAKDIVDLELIRTISKSEDSPEKYGLDAKGTRVILKNGTETKADIILGNRTTDNFQILKETDQAKIYAASKINKAFYDQDLLSWRDRSIIDLSSEQVSTIEVSLPNESFILSKEEDDWTMNKDDFELDINVVNSMVSTLTALQASDFVEEGATNFSSKSNTITINSKIKLLFGPTDKEKNLRYLKKEGQNEIYLISESSANILLKESNSYRKVEE